MLNGGRDKKGEFFHLWLTPKSYPSFTSTGTSSPILVYQYFVVTVNEYIEICKHGLPTSVRPDICPICGGSQIHRHGKFNDKYFHAGAEWPNDVPFTLFRFLCYSHCNNGKNYTFSFFPCFKAPHQSISIPLQEEFIHVVESGISINQAALQVFPNQDYSHRTLQRLKERILSIAKSSEAELTSAMIQQVPQISFEDLPHKSAFSFLSLLWQRVIQYLPKFKAIPVAALFNSNIFSRTWLEYQ